MALLTYTSWVCIWASDGPGNKRSHRASLQDHSLPLWQCTSDAIEIKSVAILVCDHFIGTVTDGEFCQLRSLGETRALHIDLLIRNSRNAVTRMQEDTLEAQIVPMGGIAIATVNFFRYEIFWELILVHF